MKIVNPATEELITEVEEDSAAAIGCKVELARAGQRQWQARPLKERIACLAKFLTLMQRDTDRLARTLTRETGKPLRESMNELAGAAKRIRYFLEHAESWLNRRAEFEDAGTREEITYEPLGVIANISAWNYPYLIGMNVIVPALIGGNAVLYKPSEYATLTGLAIAGLLEAAEVPTNVFVAVIGGPAAGRALCSEKLDGYFFTGSYRTGVAVAQALKERLVPVGLELGGKDPLFVADDVADINRTAVAIAEGCFYNNGQSCCAVERLYVHARIYDAFLAAFLASVGGLRVGDPLESTTTQGPLTRQAHLQFLQEQIHDAVSKGARIETGGGRVNRQGYFFAPTVLTGVDHSMRVMTEESFGPVIGIMPVKDDTEAIRLMNDTEYGLTAAVYSASETRARCILERLDTGTAYWNCCDRVSPYLPWSGRRHSGLGSTLSFLGQLAFVQPKSWHLRGAV